MATPRKKAPEHVVTHAVNSGNAQLEISRIIQGIYKKVQESNKSKARVPDPWELMAGLMADVMKIQTLNNYAVGEIEKIEGVKIEKVDYPL
jgi:hypothetical protein